MLRWWTTKALSLFLTLVSSTQAFEEPTRGRKLMQSFALRAPLPPADARFQRSPPYGEPPDHHQQGSQHEGHKPPAGANWGLDGVDVQMPGEGVTRLPNVPSIHSPPLVGVSDSGPLVVFWAFLGVLAGGVAAVGLLKAVVVFSEQQHEANKGEGTQGTHELRDYAADLKDKLYALRSTLYAGPLSS
mmetsp:Transcript_280/g.604  ORF Transcript_280/g.604 Transcript_280/m.604 type:complete len:187 (-) Transcript_280:185-745(-)